MPGQPQRPEQGKARRYAEPVDTGGRFVTKKVDTNVNPADLMTKPLAKPKVEQLMSIMYEFLG